MAVALAEIAVTLCVPRQSYAATCLVSTPHQKSARDQPPDILLGLAGGSVLASWCALLWKSLGLSAGGVRCRHRVKGPGLLALPLWHPRRVRLQPLEQQRADLEMVSRARPTQQDGDSLHKSKIKIGANERARHEHGTFSTVMGVGVGNDKLSVANFAFTMRLGLIEQAS